MVSWTAPDDGGSPIISYTVTRYVAECFPGRRRVHVSGDVGGRDGPQQWHHVHLHRDRQQRRGFGLPSAPSLQVTPQIASLSLVNGGTLAGRPQKGDQIIVTLSPAPSPGAFCAAWNATSYPDLDDSGVVVQGKQATSGDDTITVTDATDCNGGFHFGTIDLGQSGYFNSDVTFGGNVTGCRNGKTTACSTIHWDGKNTLTITLGAVSSAQSTQTAPSVAVYTPAPSLGLVATISSTKEENF